MNKMIKNTKIKIGVVLVTRNRLSCLKIALKKYDEQIKQPEYMIVVDNCSTDKETGKYLDNWVKESSSYKRIVIHSNENGGGSGGFYLAEKEALKHEADWIWHADDDAYPDASALQEIEIAYNHINKNVAAYCSAVKNVSNPKIDISYWRILYKGIFFIKWLPPKNTDKYFDVDKFMYLGCVIKKDVLEKVGLTNKEFFIHEDDIEHSLRIRKTGRIIAVNDAHLLHPAWNDVINPKSINWKYYYSVRNKIISIGLNYGKKYQVSEIMKAKLKYYLHVIKKYPPTVLAMEKDAISDGKRNILGKNKLYLPK